MSDAVARIFSDAGRVQRMLDVEVALARAQAAAGLVPEAAVEGIAAAAQAGNFDLAALRHDAYAAGNLAIPLVAQLTAVVERHEADAARFVHWGATSQDIIDTGLILQLREALPLIDGNLERAASAAARLARRHAGTPMPGRTWLQQATPVTFGLKAAGWLDALARTTTGLRDAAEAAMVLQFGGASGTLAALGDRALDVSARLGEVLGLPVPAMPWRAPGLVSTMLSAMPQEHERGPGGWQAEWDTLPELMILTSTAAAAAADALEHLTVSAEAMHKSLQATHGLAMAESVMMQLAPHVGKAAAHRIVDRAARIAIDARRDFADVLCEDPEVSRRLDRQAVEAALAAESYLGAATQFVARVLADAGADARRQAGRGPAPEGV
jgi:3-carboxy-cis,cis-muconate cycloisomerase